MAKDFTLTMSTKQSPEVVFNTVLRVRDWWQGFYAEDIQGEAEKVGDEFIFQAGQGAHNTTQKLTEMIPNKKIVWLVTHSKLTFIADQPEWKNTRLIFDISKNGNKTSLRFTHEGLTPTLECYEACSNGWKLYLNEKLLKLLEGSLEEKKTPVTR